MKTRLTRRRFLGTTAALGTGLAVLPARLVRGTMANEKVHVALVGVGGRGGWFVDTIPRLEQVVAVCDVNEEKVAGAFRHWEEAGARYSASAQDWQRRAGAEFQRLLENRPKVFRDFRKMLDEMGDRVDAVVVATPDHSHAVVSAAAIRAGKHVFCEKPLTRTLHESRALRQLAREQGVATSMGNQGTYSGAFRRALELIRAGELGEIEEVHVWNSGGGADRQEPPRGEPPVPPGFDWDLWLGPAAMRPYHREWTQRHLWREFGTCQLGNWASHSANLGFMALKVHDLWLAEQAASKATPKQGEPATQPSQTCAHHAQESRTKTLKVTAKASRINRLSFPKWETVAWEIPARADLPPIAIRWYNGAAPGIEELIEPVLATASQKDRNNWRFAGTLIVGTKGTIHTTGHNMWFQLLPADRFDGVQCNRPETVESSRGPEQDWFAACRGGPRPWANFDYASALNEFLMLGNVATQFEETLEFDPVAMKIVNNAEADGLLRSEYREGWSL